KAGAIPIEFGKNPDRFSQKDVEARWTKKGNEVHFGYKNHVKANRKHKLIEDYEVTPRCMTVKRGYRNKPLTEEQKQSNWEKSKIRVRVEHIFGHMTNAMRDGMRDGMRLRNIGLKRITATVGLLNLAYNMARYEQIVRLHLA